MLDYITGLVHINSQNQVVISIGGVGISVFVPSSLRSSLSEGQMAKIYTHLCIKDEEIKLYGFSNEQEREMFLKLQTITGIGPSVSLNILSSTSLQKICHAIMTENVDFFRTIKGIGPKTASRIVLELKGSLKNMEMLGNFEVDSMCSNAIKALVILGYQEVDASECVHQTMQTEKPKNLESLVAQSLQKLQER